MKDNGYFTSLVGRLLLATMPLWCAPAWAVANPTFAPGTPPTASSEQQATQKITGTVVDSHGEPLIGVTVKLKNGHAGAVTDLDGHFSIDAPQGAWLVVSYVGAKDQEVRATNNMRIQLDDNVSNLSEAKMIIYFCADSFYDQP